MGKKKDGRGTIIGRDGFSQNPPRKSTDGGKVSSSIKRGGIKPKPKKGST